MDYLAPLGIAVLNEDYVDSEIYKWAGFDDDDKPISVNLGHQSSDNISALIATFEDTRYSVSIDGDKVVGVVTLQT